MKRQEKIFKNEKEANEFFRNKRDVPAFIEQNTTWTVTWFEEGD